MAARLEMRVSQSCGGAGAPAGSQRGGGRLPTGQLAHRATQRGLVPGKQRKELRMPSAGGNPAPGSQARAAPHPGRKEKAPVKPLSAFLSQENKCSIL